MDDHVNTNGGGQDQRRARAVRDFEDDLDRELDDLEFEVCNTIHAESDPSAAGRAVTRRFSDQRWTIRRFLRGLV